MNIGLVESRKEMKKKKGFLANGHESIDTGSTSAVSSAKGSFFIEDHVPRTGKGPSFISEQQVWMERSETF